MKTAFGSCRFAYICDMRSLNSFRGTGVSFIRMPPSLSNRTQTERSSLQSLKGNVRTCVTGTIRPVAGGLFWVNMHRRRMRKIVARGTVTNERRLSLVILSLTPGCLRLFPDHGESSLSKGAATHRFVRSMNTEGRLSHSLFRECHRQSRSYPVFGL